MPIIIAGKRRGAKLLVPDGLGVRPTLVRVREALFSMLYSIMGSFEGCRVLDPFAGAGLLGLEVWSRGAAHVDFMEQSRTHYAILTKNIATLRANPDVTAKLGQSPRDWNAFDNQPYHLVLCDPPYAVDIMPRILATLDEQKKLTPGALVSIESDSSKQAEYPKNFELLKDRTYGKCRISILRYNA